MNIEGDKIQTILKKWRYNSYRIISISVSEDGYELIAAGQKSKGVFVKAMNLDEAVHSLENEIETNTREDYWNAIPTTKWEKQKTVA